jgi:hypothetical protein
VGYLCKGANLIPIAERAEQLSPNTLADASAVSAGLDLADTR